MKLKKIQVSGFKSFVDTTTLRMSSNIIGVVGPNGCGKSNVIDAIRWVMGEMSAKNLRGGSMSDVIFNGSVNRKPVGRASVELVFDNSDQRVDGPYAMFSEISVKRTLSRDGTSEYLVNNIPARRRDITDIFLGTGLGPRSYSIIEQGMVSRIIEAKPEELRSFVEEASGVSRYKDRRRETENRIRHTRENLERIDDIRRELDSQIRRLQRQSEAARKYREYRAEERQVRGELLGLRYKDLSGQLDSFNDEAKGIEDDLAKRETEITGFERDGEAKRAAQAECQELLNKAQGEFYAVGSEISNVESRIEHARETLEKNQSEAERLRAALAENEQQLETDRNTLGAVISEASELEPRVSHAQVSAGERSSGVDTAEHDWNGWQGSWEQFSDEATQPERQREVQQARIEEIERHVRKLGDRRERLADESARIETARRQVQIDFLRDEVAEGERLWREREQRVEAMDVEMSQVRQSTERTANRLDEVRERYNEMATRLASLEQVQATLHGEAGEALEAELESRGLTNAPRLADVLRVEPGWEHAVDAVLGRFETAWLVDNLDELLTAQANGQGETLGGTSALFIERRPGVLATRFHSLAARVRSDDVDVVNLFAGAYTCATLAEATAMRPRLGAGECAVTRDGTIVDAHSVQFSGDATSEAGVLAREQEINALGEQVGVIERELNDLKVRFDAGERRARALDDYRSTERRALSEMSRQHVELEGRLGRQESRDTEMESRSEEITREIAEIDEQLDHDRNELSSSRESLSLAVQMAGTIEQRRRDLLLQRDVLRAALEAGRTALSAALDDKHQLELDYGRVLASRESVEGSISRLEVNIAGMRERLTEVQREITLAENPELRFGGELRELREKRRAAETRLSELRQNAQELEKEHRRIEERRRVLEREAQTVREQLQNRQVARQEIVVRRQTVNEQVQGLGSTVEAILEALPEEADESEWEERVNKLARRIDRIGPVNLVAIEELEEQMERKELLDTHATDLYKALEHLEGVMGRIDKETKQRFLDTYNALNSNFQDFFPKLFGGGSAELRLADEDILNGGVSVMARPPGKRNTSIALLSGGEKAMTAVALLFSLFRLNPAPFCLLDEVDAPLDDANVERYCTLLKGLADHTQLIFITHNKITMAIADSLIGVTMGEPGVSRLVAVDVDEALAFAEA